MSVTLTSPGVYIQELPSGSRTLTGVGTSVAAFVGRSLRGPTDKAVRITSWADFERQFGGLWAQSGMSYSVRDYFLNGGSIAVIVRVAPSASSAKAVVDSLKLKASSEGAWGNNISATITHINSGLDDIALAQGVDVGELFTLTLSELSSIEGEPPLQEETYVNVTVVDGPRQVDKLLQDSRIATVDGALPGARPGTATSALIDANNAAVAGSDGDALSTSAHYLGNAAAKTGIHALRDADLFTLLCIPPSSPTGSVPDGVWTEALALCVEERAFLIVDPPADTNKDAIEGWMTGGAALTGTASRNAAVYFPRIRKPDPLREGVPDIFPPSGVVAGLMARTDTNRGVWKAPAGLEAGLAGVNGPEHLLTDGEQGPLNSAGVNCIRTFPGAGTVVWGARTARGSDRLADEYRYVPVRRLALFLEESLFRGTQWVVFEPNDEPLWSEIRTTLGGFMQSLFRQGAFQGATPKDAYFVRCDAETTTQYDIDRGVVNISVGFAPLKPAEFVVISIQQKTSNPS